MQTFQCQLCFLCFQRKWNLDRHLKNVHSFNLIKNAKTCVKCGKSFQKIKSFRFHQKNGKCKDNKKIIKCTMSRLSDLPSIRIFSNEIAQKIDPSLFYLEYADRPFIIRNYKNFQNKFVLDEVLKTNISLEIRDCEGYYLENPKKDWSISSYLKDPKGKYAVGYLCRLEKHEYLQIFPNFFGNTSETFDWAVIFLQTGEQKPIMCGKKKIYNKTPFHQDLPPMSGVWHYLVQGTKQVVLFPSNEETQKLKGKSIFYLNNKRSLFDHHDGVQGILSEGDLLYFPSDYMHEFWALTPNTFSFTNAVFNPYYFPQCLKNLKPKEREDVSIWMKPYRNNLRRFLDHIVNSENRERKELCFSKFIIRLRCFLDEEMKNGKDDECQKIIIDFNSELREINLK